MAKSNEPPVTTLADISEPGLAASLRSVGQSCEIKHAEQNEWSTEVDKVLEAAAKTGAVHISASAGTQWDCVSKMIFLINQGGVKVGFISNPSGKEPHQ